LQETWVLCISYHALAESQNIRVRVTQKHSLAESRRNGPGRSRPTQEPGCRFAQLRNWCVRSNSRNVRIARSIARDTSSLDQPSSLDRRNLGPKNI